MSRGLGDVYKRQAVYNVAGTRAAAVADAPASFKVAFIDELYRASAQDIADNKLELEEA